MVVPASNGFVRRYSNSTLTDWSACVNRMAFASSSPTESTCSDGKRRSGGRLMESVTTTSLIGAFMSRSTAGPLNSACVADGAGRVDHVVGNEAIPAFDFTDNVHHFGHVGLRTTLVDDGERGVETLGKATRHLRRSDVGGHDAQVFEPLLAEIIREHRRGIQVIDGHVEEPLQLVRMKIEAQHAIGTGGLDEVGHELGANRDARLILTILPGVSRVGEHGGHAGGRGTARCVDEQQQLEHIFARRIRGLDHVHVRPTDVLVDAHEHLPVSETRTGHFTQLGAERLRDLFRQRHIRRAREDLEAAWQRGRCVQRRSHPEISTCVKGVGTEPVQMGRSVAGTSV